jgi:hypothetical protein
VGPQAPPPQVVLDQAPVVQPGGTVGAVVAVQLVFATHLELLVHPIGLTLRVCLIWSGAQVPAPHVVLDQAPVVQPGGGVEVVVQESSATQVVLLVQPDGLTFLVNSLSPLLHVPAPQAPALHAPAVQVLQAASAMHLVEVVQPIGFTVLVCCL